MKSITNSVWSAVQAVKVLRRTWAVMDSLQVEIESVRQGAGGGAEKQPLRAKAAGATQVCSPAAASIKAAGTNAEEAAAVA